MAASALHGAIALVKVNGNYVSLMKSWDISEQGQRLGVQGLGTILNSEAPITKWSCSLTCDFIATFSIQTSGIPGALNRAFANAKSAVASGGTSFEDQLVLNTNGVQVDLFTKVQDVLDANGNIKPKLIPFASIHDALIETDRYTVSENSFGGHNQTFIYLTPILQAP